MKIYTGTGDGGETGLFSGQRVSKNHPRVRAYGALDELNCILGVAAASGPSDETRAALTGLQRTLFYLGTDLATILPPGEQPRVSAKMISWIEGEMDSLSAKLPALRAFVFPGGSPAAAQIHLARSIARRVEREALCAAGEEALPKGSLVFLNRLSDYLFLLARRENQLGGVEEHEWRPL